MMFYIDLKPITPIIEQMPKLKIFVIILCGITALSFASILIKLTNAPSIVIAAGRLLVAAILLQPIFWINFSKVRYELKVTDMKLIVLSGIFLALHFVLWIESLRHTSVTSSVVLVATDPIFVAILSPVFLKERISLKLMLAIIIGTIGVGIIAYQGISSNILTKGNLLALGGAICAGVYLIIGRKVRMKISLISYIFIMYSTAAVILTVMVFITGNRFTGYSSATYLFIILLGLGPQLVGHTSFNWALRYLTAPVVAMTILGEPIGTAILSWIILSQPPTFNEVIGGVMICIGIYFATISVG